MPETTASQPAGTRSGSGAPSRVRIAGLTLLAASAVLTGVGTALPWLTETAILPAPDQQTHEVGYAFAGLEYGNGWIVLFAGVLIAALTVASALIRDPRLHRPLLVPVVVGALALGDWLGALSRGGSELPAGVAISLAGLLLATPAAALLHPGRAPARLGIAAATLVATGFGLLAGVLVEMVIPILVLRTF